ncbi:MAG: pseudouridine synthase [Tepidiformaceae bacterium]
MADERLQKILSNAGVSSRRVAEELIVTGRVTVNGEVQDTLGARADPDADEIVVDGVPVLRERYRYFMLNKPAGFITTSHDEMDRETVFDLVPIGDIQLHTVGRLDRDSEGLVLLTNDGHLTDLLTHPRYEVDKEYLVGLDSMPGQRDLQRLVRGVEHEGERLRAATAQPAAAPAPGLGDDSPGAASWLVVVLREGKNREVRRMLEAIGKKVLVLRRIRVGPLHVGNLGSGAFRELTEDEVTALYAAGKQAESRDEAVTPSRAERRRTIGSLEGPKDGGGPAERRPKPPAKRAATPRQGGEARGRTPPPGATPAWGAASGAPQRSAPKRSAPARRADDSTPRSPRPPGPPRQRRDAQPRRPHP